MNNWQGVGDFKLEIGRGGRRKKLESTVLV